MAGTFASIAEPKTALSPPGSFDSIRNHFRLACPAEFPMTLADDGSILYVSMADVSLPNGPGVNEREFVTSLQKRFGDRAHVVLPEPRRDCDGVDWSQATTYRSASHRQPLRYVRQQIELRAKVLNLLERRSFDLMVMRLCALPLAAYWLRKVNVPIVIKTLGEVGGFAWQPGVTGLVRRPLARLDRLLVRDLLDHVAVADCCTPQLVDFQRVNFGFPANRLACVPNATNVSRFQPIPSDEARSRLGLTDRNPILGFVGGSPRERGGMQILEIVTRLRRDYPQLGAVVVGDDSDESLRIRTAELTLENHVVIPGVVPYHDVPDYVNAFDVCYAFDRFQRHHVIGNSYQKVRQYLSCGKPVISCIDEESPLVRQRLVAPAAPDDLDQIEQLTRELLERNTTQREQFAARARAYACEHLSSDSTLQQRLTFWEPFVSSRPALAKAQAA